MHFVPRSQEFLLAAMMELKISTLLREVGTEDHLAINLQNFQQIRPRNKLKRTEMDPKFALYGQKKSSLFVNKEIINSQASTTVFTQQSHDVL